MRRSEYLFRLILGGVGVSTLFKMVAAIAMLVAPNSLNETPGPMSHTFARVASVPELTKDLQPLLGLLRPESAEAATGVPGRAASGLVPNDQNVVVVLNAVPCFTKEGLERLESAGLADRCTSENRTILERQVRLWSIGGGVIIILFGALGWWADDLLRRRYLESGRGYPQTVEVLKDRFDSAIRDARRSIGDTVPSEFRPDSHRDLTSGQFRFLQPDLKAVRDPEAPGMTFWLVSGLIVTGSALTALSGGLIVAGIMLVFAFLALIVSRIFFDQLRGQGEPYRLAYEVVTPSTPTEGPVGENTPVPDEEKASSVLDARLEIVAHNVGIYHDYIKKGLEKVATQGRNEDGRRLALPLFLGLMAVLAGNWVGGGMIQLMDRQFTDGNWALGEGLASPVALWSALEAVNPLARPVLLTLFALGLILSFCLAIWSDRRVSDTRSGRNGVVVDPVRILAIVAAWLLAVYVAAVLTWLSGVQMPSGDGPVLVRGGLVCDVRSVSVPSDEDASASWAFGDPDRPAFTLQECQVNHLMRYPQPTVSELTRSDQPAEVIFVVGLASFEGEVARQEQLAMSRALALATAVPAGQDTPVYSLLLGRSKRPVVSARQSPSGATTLSPTESADQRKVLVYLAGRRGVRNSALSTEDVQGLLRGIRADLQALDTDPGEYSTCLVQRLDRKTDSATLVDEPALSVIFGCTAG